MAFLFSVMTSEHLIRYTKKYRRNYRERAENKNKDWRQDHLCMVIKMEEKIRLSGIVSDSIVDGVGIRMVIFTQGCFHGCKGCHNPQTHDINGGYDETADSILKKFKSNPISKGITLSGGEPFLQAKKLLPICKAVREMNKDIWAWSGFLFEDLKNDIIEGTRELLDYVDVLVDGKFEENKLDLNLWYRGSSNQRIIDVKKSLQSNRTVIIEFPDE